MELHRLRLPLILVLLLFSSATAALGESHPPSPSPAATPAPKPKSKPPPSRIGGSPSPARSTLDPKQLAALQSMNLPTTDDPCSLPAPHNFTTCDSSTPFSHVVGLTLANCSAGLDFSATALRALSTSLVSFSFVRCPIDTFPMPSSLISNLRSFSVVASFKKLTGVYLSHLANLTELVVTDAPIQASGIAVVLSRMKNLRSVQISRTKIPGGLPHNWNCPNLKKLDLSTNGLDGSIPPSIGTLKDLEFLNLSSNALSGALPQTLANMASLKTASFSHNSLTGPLPDLLTKLPDLEHLDVSYNRINGTVPKFLMKIKGLKHLNLAYNNFHGVLPFDASFIKNLDAVKLGGNSNLCYNHTVLSSKLKLGIARCDKFGMPVSPPPDRHASSSSDDVADDSESKNSGGGHHGPNKTVLAVAIGLACLVFLVVFIVCLSKMCR